MRGTKKWKFVRLLAAGAWLAIQACDSKGAERAPIDELGDDEEQMDAGPRVLDSGSKRDSGGDAGAVLGPLIEVLSPAATDDPASADVLIGTTLTVRCRVERNPKGELVDLKTVKVSVYPNDDLKAAITQVATSSSESDVFQAENIPMAMVPHGPIRVECTASDLATKPQASSSSILSLYDQGPKVTFLSPMEKGYVAVGDGKPGPDVTIRFKVEGQPLGDDDEGAEVAQISAFVGGREITNLERSTLDADVYSFQIDFNDTQLFTAVPKTLGVRIDASNKRAPKPRAISANLSVGVDAEGPTIVVKSPARTGGQDPVVSGKVDLVMEVKDVLAGVNQGTVQIQIQKNSDGSGADPGNDFYPAQALGDGTYVASFETGTYVGRPRITITLLAKDNVAIATQSSLTVDVDTVPPWISLDPPTVRERELRTAFYECSGAFDPLGDAVNEGVVIGNAYRVRALIWDRPLTTANATSNRYAMIDNTTAKLYIQHNSTVPLLIDSDNDANHECDKINVSLENMALQPTAIVLAPVKSAGTPKPSGEWTSTTVMTGPMMTTTVNTFHPDMSADPSVVGECTSIPAIFNSPATISSDTTMTRVIKHVIGGSSNPIDVVYADSPTMTGPRSTGSDYNTPRPGWACLVAAAKDNAGNLGFSPPLRVCAEHSGYTCEATPPPSLTCTDGCVIPSKFLRDAPTAMPRILEYLKN